MVEVFLLEKIFRFYYKQKYTANIIIPTCYQINGMNYDLIVKDVIDQIYYKINKGSKFRNKCKYAKFINAKFIISTTCTSDLTVMIPYLDGVLYNPYNKSDITALERQNKINNLLK